MNHSANNQTGQQNNKHIRGGKGGKSPDSRTKTRERIHRQPIQSDSERDKPAGITSQFGQPAQFGQTGGLLQRQLPKPALSTASHTTLHPALVLAPTTPLIQPKLAVNEPNDRYEVEADRVADQVMRMPSGDLLGQNMNGWGRNAPTSPPLQLKCAVCGGDEEMAMRSVKSMTPEVTPTIERNIHRMQGGGKPLDDSSRSFFEQRMGADFSNVRIHTDANAIQTSRDINAKAFTAGNNIAFNSGEYNPNTSAGKHLLAHELTHTIQQDATNHIQEKSEDVENNPLPNQLILQRKCATDGVQKEADRELRTQLMIWAAQQNNAFDQLEEEMKKEKGGTIDGVAIAAAVASLVPGYGPYISVGITIVNEFAKSIERSVGAGLMTYEDFVIKYRNGHDQFLEQLKDCSHPAFSKLHDEILPDETEELVQSKISQMVGALPSKDTTQRILIAQWINNAQDSWDNGDLTQGKDAGHIYLKINGLTNILNRKILWTVDSGPFFDDIERPEAVNSIINRLYKGASILDLPFEIQLHINLIPPSPQHTIKPFNRTYYHGIKKQTDQPKLDTNPAWQFVGGSEDLFHRWKREAKIPTVKDLEVD